MRILVFQTAFLGDAILSIPLLKAIRHFYPRAVIGYVCRKNVGELFLRTGLADHVFEVDKRSKKSFQHCFRETKAFGADTIVSAHRSLRTALWVWRLKPKLSVGYDDWWCGWAYKKKIKRISEFHDVIRQVSLIEGLGPRLGEVPDSLVSLHVPLEKSLPLELPRSPVILAPGSQWETKRWTLSGFAEVGKSLQKAGFPIVIVGTSQEKDVCGKLAQALPQSVDLSGKTTVYELARVMASARALVCNDSGAMHVAALSGIPIVSIFGATVPAQGYSPWQKEATIVEVELSCRPCGAHGHKKCPLGHHDCMKKVSPQLVLGALKPYLRVGHENRL